MDLTKRYADIDGNKRTILQVVRKEPEWAANRIQCGEEAIEENVLLRKMLAFSYAGKHLYGDDGELQDNRFGLDLMIDFRRDSAVEIDRKITKRGILILAKERSRNGTISLDV